MSDIERIINSLKRKGNDFEIALTELREQDNGLPSDLLKSLLSHITSEKFEKCKASHFTDLLFCCIPETSLSKDISNMPILWMLYKYSDESIVPSKINAVLQWAIGMLQFNIIEKAHVDGYYELYYELLSKDSCQRLACKLIHMLTRPGDVYRARVERILKLYRKSGERAKHLAHLIELFKTYKPELVPENVKSYSHEAAFKSLPPGLIRGLEAAQQRAHLQNHGQLRTKSDLNWKAVTSKKNKSGIPLIPTAVYTHLGSELYRDKRRKVVDYLDKLSLASYHSSCEIPTSILSLMLNEGGIHFLVAHNSEIHARFSSVLYYCLHSVFILNDQNIPYQEREHFLSQLILVEDYMQQGIPVVSRFLAYYIASWNGFDHQSLIYRLLERITVVNFAEFNDCILIHLQTLFLSGDTQEKVLIIKTLSELTFNMYNLWTKQVPKEYLFLSGKCDWTTDFHTAVPQLIQMVGKFCESGLLLTSNDPSVQHVSLCFFETLAGVQSNAKMEITVIPPTIFYRCIFSLDFSSLARACSLLLRYKNVGEDSDLSEIYSADGVILLNKYSCDVWNSLINDKAMSKARQGYILDRCAGLKQILSDKQSDSVFNLKYHPAMLGLGLHMKAIASDVVLSDEALRDVVAESFPELGECLEALKVKYSEYHGRL